MIPLLDQSIPLYGTAFESINTIDHYQYVGIGEVNFQFGPCTFIVSKKTIYKVLSKEKD
jgi:hypothetical protein